MVASFCRQLAATCTILSSFFSLFSNNQIHDVFSVSQQVFDLVTSGSVAVFWDRVCRSLIKSIYSSKIVFFPFCVMMFCFHHFIDTDVAKQRANSITDFRECLQQSCSGALWQLIFFRWTCRPNAFHTLFHSPGFP